jgi:hypothetical protein
MVTVSIGNIFLVKDLSINPNLIKLADVIIYLNAAAILYLLIHSIILRRMLITFNQQLDEDVISPSDFTLIGRNLPLNLT